MVSEVQNAIGHSVAGKRNNAMPFWTAPEVQGYIDSLSFFDLSAEPPIASALRLP